MKNIKLLHCFPVPYRNYLFEIMHMEAKSRNYNFEVLFYDKFDESRPNWVFSAENLKYSHKYFKPNFKRGPVLHLNFDLLKYLMNSNVDILISGGVWSSLNSIVLIMFSKIQIIGWDETNRFDFGSQKKNYLFLKKMLVKKLKYLAVPGLESKLYYKELIGEYKLSKKNILNLPNLIDESLFESIIANKKVIEVEISEKYPFLDFTKTIVYWPARYIEDKGIENFLEIIDLELLKNAQIFLLGHGPLKEKISALIERKGFTENIFMLDSMRYEDSIKFYAISDLVLMPSLSDSNPLTLVEAIHSSLPLLISKRVGNLNEVLIEGENGYSFDPSNNIEVYRLTKLLFKTSKNKLKEMGEISKKIAYKNFNSKEVVKVFFNNLESIDN